MRDRKTTDQLRSEILYFTAVLHRTTSRDRRQRAHRALVRRERLLYELTKSDGGAHSRAG